MKTLPTEVQRYSTSREFTDQSTPENLLNEHRTKANTWGRIVILEGKLRYHILEPETEVIELAPDTDGIVEPEVLHKVEPIGSVRFQLEFYR